MGTQHGGEVVGRDVGTVGSASAERRHALRVVVEPADDEAGAGEFDGQWKTDVSLADHADAGLATSNALDQARLAHAASNESRRGLRPVT